MFAFIGTLFGLMFMLFLWVLGALATIFWIWMLIHAITNKGLRDMEKIIWVLVVLFLDFIGALIYFFVGRPRAVGTASKKSNRKEKQLCSHSYLVAGKFF